MRTIIGVSILALLFVSSVVNAAENNPTEIFRECAPAVVRVEVRERTSNARESHGSGFFATRSGNIITNYHVISSLLFQESDSTLHVVTQDMEDLEASILALDVVHDLALISVKKTPLSILELGDVKIESGHPLHSIGFPLELGLTVSPGQFTRELGTTSEGKIHFTGSINRGMSGGPVILGNCKVIGVNAAALFDAEQVGFLVPARFAKALIENAPKFSSSYEELREEVRKALLDYQATYVGLDIKSIKTVPLGDYSVPSDILPSVECYSKADRDPSRRFDYRHHECRSRQPIHVNEKISAGYVTLFYTNYRSLSLNRFQFASMLQELIGKWKNNNQSSSTEFSSFRCSPNIVKTETSKLMLHTCLREYRKLPGLFELVLIGSTLDEEGESLVSYLQFNSVSLESAKHLTRLILLGTRWTPNS